MDTDTLIKEFHARQTTKKADRTADRYTQDVRDWAGWLQNPGGKSYDPNSPKRDAKGLSDATTHDIRTYLRQMLNNGGYAGGTISMRESSISVFYQEYNRMAEDPGRELSKIENPAENLDLSGWTALKNGTKKEQNLKEGVQYLKPNDIDQLAENVPNPTLRNELITRLLYHTGLRRTELTETRIEDLNTDEREIKVRATKTHQNRSVYYQPPLDPLINRWLNVERKALSTAGSEYLFPTTHSEQIDPNRITRMVKEAAEKSGLQSHVHTDASGNDRGKVTAHVLRHSFAVQSIKNGIDTRRLQKLMGHSKIETTEQYLQFANDDLRDAARKFGAGSE
jgi:integrase/recombinase XerD